MLGWVSKRQWRLVPQDGYGFGQAGAALLVISDLFKELGTGPEVGMTVTKPMTCTLPAGFS